ncbi:NAD(P)H-binding protein [Spirosoma rhododendri]|uniref:NAD(P)H-binding protein n=1 Tax=Spirosoma rhododendri TaxID=2728024 RepID=A0A7L5DKA3_9BACT|nr:NAD(P)H-binding protein [Spirosoma rhododendri]QJD78894.1 NAD(P)H-binding protein [Spirosoma rhododendri]
MHTPPKTLVLGATGGIGYAITNSLLARQWPVTILVRNRAKATALFATNQLLTIVEGDAQDAARVDALAADVDFIVHAINYPYHQWFGRMESVTRHVIEAAKPRPERTLPGPATIVFPGNVYNFGNTHQPIRPDSQPAPCTRKGQLRVELEAMLQQAADAGQCRVLTVRLPDFWGPNVLNEGIAPVLRGALTGQPMPWLVNADIPHQFVYTPDAGEVTARLMEQHWHDRLTSANEVPAYRVWNYGGTTHTSMRDWFGQMMQQTGKVSSVRVYPRWLFSVLGLFNPVMREVKEMLYLYENTIRLDDRDTLAALPDFRPTPMNQALRDTLRWFSETQLKN